jgi:LysR family transcriptional regulator, hydrogen peroxide-inducible genes activator
MAQPTIKQLRFLIALDDYRNFGKAAAACHISQSAFSLAIKELEAKLNVRLVDRTNRRLAFTEIGRAITDQARLCIGDIEALMGIAASSHEPLNGRLALGVIPTIAPFLLPAVLPEIRKRFPDLQLYLREDKTRVIHEQLLEGRLDLILIALPFEMRGVVKMPLFDDPFLFACREHSQWLAGQQGDIDIDALPEESILLLDDGHCLRDHALHACHLRGTDQISRFAATSLQTLLQMVANDLGVTFIPAMARDSIMLQGSNIELHPMPTDTCRQIGLAWRKGSGREKEFEAFGSLIGELYQGTHGQ